MPMYEYRCRGCGYEFELLVLRASSPPACPACNALHLERVLSGFAVSSEGIRNANVRAAKKKAAGDSNRRDKRISEQEHAREHFAEEGIVLPPPAKVKI